MPAPTAYTDTQLKTYMHAAVGAVGAMLGWSVGAGSYDEPLNDVLLAAGISDATGSTDVKKLRALARVYAWRAAVASLPAYYDFQSADETFNRSAAMKGALAALAAAEADAAPYGVGAHVAYLDAIDRTQDPYEYYPADDVVA